MRIEFKKCIYSDGHGLLDVDSAIIMFRKKDGFSKLSNSLKAVLRRDVSEEEVLLYLLAFLNSSIFNEMLDKKIHHLDSINVKQEQQELKQDFKRRNFNLRIKGR